MRTFGHFEIAFDPDRYEFNNDQSLKGRKPRQILPTWERSGDEKAPPDSGA